MEIIKVTEDRMNRVLPKNILESDVLSKEAKKVLATIVNYIFVQQKAKNEGYLVIANNALVKSVGMTKYYTMNAIQELIDCKLIERKAGKAWQKGDAKMASEYWVNWKALNEPIKKMNFEELFEQFSKETKSLENPISSTISISIPNSISTPTSLPVSHVHKKHKSNIQENLSTSTALSYKIIEEEIKKDEQLKSYYEEQFKNWAKKVNKERMENGMD